MSTFLIFASGDPPPVDLVEDLPVADSTIAADGGYDNAVDLGIKVDVVVGDLDSLDADILPHHVMVERHPKEKDATDLELALELAISQSPDRIVIVGGSGGRIDHELANASVICSPRWDAAGEIDWISRRGRAHVVTSHRSIHGDVGSTITLLPIGGPAVGINTRGLKWNLEDETLEVGSGRGVSNELASPVADVRVSRGRLLAVLPGA